MSHCTWPSPEAEQTHAARDEESDDAYLTLDASPCASEVRVAYRAWTDPELARQVADVMARAASAFLRAHRSSV